MFQELKRLKSELIGNLKNRPESQVHKYRHSEEQHTIQGKDQQSEEKERPTQSCTDCGKTGHTISNCWKKGWWSLPRGSAVCSKEEA